VNCGDKDVMFSVTHILNFLSCGWIQRLEWLTWKSDYF